MRTKDLLLLNPVPLRIKKNKIKCSLHCQYYYFFIISFILMTCLFLKLPKRLFLWKTKLKQHWLYTEHTVGSVCGPSQQTAVFDDTLMDGNVNKLIVYAALPAYTVWQFFYLLSRKTHNNNTDSKQVSLRAAGKQSSSISVQHQRTKPWQMLCGSNIQRHLCRYERRHEYRRDYPSGPKLRGNNERLSSEERWRGWSRAEG